MFVDVEGGIPIPNAIGGNQTVGSIGYCRNCVVGIRETSGNRAQLNLANEFAVGVLL
jgi:hypothetical protein